MKASELRGDYSRAGSDYGVEQDWAGYTPEEHALYRKLFERHWAYVKSNCIDAENGEWYPDALDAGGNPKANKASEWKAGYHAGRAMLNAAEWLKCY